LPYAKAEQITLNSQPLISAVKEGVKSSQYGVTVNLGSGTYQFRYSAGDLIAATQEYKASKSN
jgi:hypothetical protein